MLALTLSAADLAAARFAVSPLGHLLHGVNESACSRRSRLRSRWWATARCRVPLSAVPVVELVNLYPSGVVPFLTPHPGAAVETALVEELERLETIRMEVIAADLQRLPGKVPRVVADLRAGDEMSWRRVVDGVRDLFICCLADDWPDIARVIRADLAARSRALMAGGMESVLSGLHPSALWNPLWNQGTLLVGQAASSMVARRERGLVLMPCAFGRDSVHPLFMADRPATLCFSAGAHEQARGDGVDPLAALLGHKRARVLRGIESGSSTKALAARLGVAPPTVSEQITVLRRAGLILTERNGKAVRHTLTVLGESLVLTTYE